MSHFGFIIFVDDYTICGIAWRRFVCLEYIVPRLNQYLNIFQVLSGVSTCWITLFSSVQTRGHVPLCNMFTSHVDEKCKYKRECYGISVNNCIHNKV